MVVKTKRQLKLVSLEALTSDDLLARAAAATRDREAFGELVRRHHARVLGLTRHLAGDSTTAEDLAAQTFLKAWEKLSSFRGDSSARFGAWLSRIAYRQFLQFTRRRKIERRLFSSTGLPDVAASDEPSAAGWASSTRLDESVADPRSSFNRLLVACSAVQAETLYMSFVLELSHEEIALVTDRPLGTVKSHIARGKAAIKAAINSPSTRVTEPLVDEARANTHP